MSASSRYIKSFNSILLLGNILGVSQFTLTTSRCLSIISSIIFIPFLASYVYLSYDSYISSTKGIREEEVVIVSYGNWIVFCIYLCATLSRFPYYFFVRCNFKQVILNVNEINKRLKLSPNYAWSTLRLWLVFLAFNAANIFVRICSDVHWSIKMTFTCGVMMYYCEIMFSYKIIDELKKQCEHMHGVMFEGLQFVQHSKMEIDLKLGGSITSALQEGSSEGQRRAYLEKFIDLAEVHLEICSCAKKANRVFGLPFMMLIILDFAIVTLVLYNLCDFIVKLDLNNYTSQQLINIVGSCVNITLIFVREITAIHIWTQLEKKLKETVFNIHKLWNILSINNQIGKWAGYIQLTTVQLSNAIPQFSAAGVFAIDWPVIISVISAASTYVVILIQFGSIKQKVDQGNGELESPEMPQQPNLLFPA